MTHDAGRARRVITVDLCGHGDPGPPLYPPRVARVGADLHELLELGAVPVTYGPGIEDCVREAAPAGASAASDLVGCQRHQAGHPLQLHELDFARSSRRDEQAHLHAHPTDEPDTPQPLGLQLLAGHHGDVLAALADDRLTHEMRQHLGYEPTKVFLNDDDDVSHLTANDHRDLVAHLATTMVAGFSRYLDQPEARPAEASYRQFALWLDAGEQDHLSRELSDLVARFARGGPGSERRQHLLTVVLFPNTA